MKEDFMIQFKSTVAVPMFKMKNPDQKAIKYFLETKKFS